MANAEELSMPIERHPWLPFIPNGAQLLFLGTFPPPKARWSMNFYYPNRTNDFWKVMGLIVENSVAAYYDSRTREYDLDAIKHMLQERYIALGDTAVEVRRLRGNASDKFLEIIRQLDLISVIASTPTLKAIAATGEKAASVIAQITDTRLPAVGEYSLWTAPDGRTLRLYRMPSTSRAYPLPVERKAEVYAKMMHDIGLIS
jgi:G:T/U-mismatch repair DNA glycosylase